MTRRKSRFACVDCGVDTGRISEYYMLLDEVWAAAGNIRGMLCIGCLEARLGRQLSARDFSDAPLNFIFPQSARLYDRLSTSPQGVIVP